MYLPLSGVEASRRLERSLSHLDLLHVLLLEQSQVRPLRDHLLVDHLGGELIKDEAKHHAASLLHH